MGKSAGSDQPMKMMLSAEYFTLRYFSQKAIYTAAWNEKGPQISSNQIMSNSTYARGNELAYKNNKDKYTREYYPYLNCKSVQVTY